MRSEYGNYGEGTHWFFEIRHVVLIWVVFFFSFLIRSFHTSKLRSHLQLTVSHRNMKISLLIKVFPNYRKAHICFYCSVKWKMKIKRSKIMCVVDIFFFCVSFYCKLSLDWKHWPQTHKWYVIFVFSFFSLFSAFFVCFFFFFRIFFFCYLIVAHIFTND